jgi:cell division inhibitor SulA/protein ImuA
MSLENLLQERPDLWRAGDPASPAGAEAVPTGFPVLDRELAGGWPRGALIELLAAGQGLGVFGLLLPALARLSRESAWIAWIAPPCLPYAPGLAQPGIDLSRLLLLDTRGPRESLWALEQALRSGNCSAVLGWPEGLQGPTLRRLQLAAEAGGASAWLFRPEAAAREVSPAVLRLRVSCVSSGGLKVEILKRRGGWTRAPLYLISDSVASR